MIRTTSFLILFLVVIFSSMSLFGELEKGAELVSLDIKAMDIRDVLKILSQKSGLNIVADNDVEGELTLYLKDVDVMEALDIILTANNLIYQQRGTFIRVMTHREDVPKEPISFKEIAQVDTIRLNNSEASRLSELIRPLTSDGGKVIADENSDTLVLLDTPKRIEEIKDAIKELDERRRSVFIDVTIVELVLLDKYPYGIDWGEFASLEDIRGSLKIGIAKKNQPALLGLLERFGEVNVLSRPHVSVTDGEEAKFHIGSKEGYTALGVLPKLNKAGFINMRIKPEIHTSRGDKRETETSVFVKDRTTIIVGGMLKDAKEFVMFLTPHIIEEPTRLDVVTQYISSLEEKVERPEPKQPTKQPKVSLTKIAEREKEKERPAKLKKADRKRLREDKRKLRQKERERKRRFVKIEKLRKEEMGREKKIARLKEKEQGRRKRLKEARRESIERAMRQRERYEKEKEKEEPKRIVTRKAERPKREEWTAVFGSGYRRKEDTSYKDYQSMIASQINEQARHQDTSGLTGEVDVEFTLDRGGSLVRGPIVLNKPDLVLVRAAVRAVKGASPFRPFPKELRKEKEGFTVTVYFE